MPKQPESHSKAAPPDGAKLPRIIIIESTALFQLGWQLEHVDFSDLLQWKDLLKFSIAVSHVSWLEFMRARYKQVDECISKERQLRSSLLKLGQGCTELKAIDDRLVELRRNLENLFQKKLSKLGVQVLPIAKLDLETLLHMSIENVAPFEEAAEKGFRDSLIMFSILEAIKGRPELNAMVVSADTLFVQGILAKQAEYRTALSVVGDLKKAVGYIGGFVDKAVRALRNKEKLEAKELLLKYRPEIEKAVGEIRELSYFDIPSALSGGHVERILSLRFNEVESATWKNRTENAATILFSLKCTLTVLVSPPIWEFLNARLQIGGGSTLLTPGNQDPKESQMEKTVFGTAEFAMKEGERGLIRLDIDTKLPMEDLVQLTASE